MILSAPNSALVPSGCAPANAGIQTKALVTAICLGYQVVILQPVQQSRTAASGVP